MKKGKNNIVNDLFNSDENLRVKKSVKSVALSKELKYPYHLIIENYMNNNSAKAVLFGHKYYSNHENYGSETCILIKSADANINYLQLLEQSLNISFKPKGIRIIADSWDVMPKSIFYKDIEFGEYQVISLLDSGTWGVKEVIGKAINDIPISKIIIKGEVKLILDVSPLSKLEILIY